VPGAVGLTLIWVQNTYKIIRLAGDVYQIDYLPMKLTRRLPAHLATPVLSLLATIIPGRRARRARPWTCCAMSDGPARSCVAEDCEREYRTGPRSVRVLRGASIPCAREVVALVGASGVGKSTLLHLLGALDRPSAGRVLFDGEDLFARSEAALARYRAQRSGSCSSSTTSSARCPRSRTRCARRSSRRRTARRASARRRPGRGGLADRCTIARRAVGRRAAARRRSRARS
jgi:hypothetical protein